MKRTQKQRGSGRGNAPAPANPMADQVGPEFHDEVGLRSALAAPGDDLLPAAELATLVGERRVLAVHAFDGTAMFPTWQVVDGAVLTGLAEVLAAMEGQPAWSVALWITTEHDDLGASPRQVLEAGGDTTALVALAAETARRWS